MEIHPDSEVLLLLLSVEPTRALAISQPPSRADFQGWPDFQERQPWGELWPPLGIELPSGCISSNTKHQRVCSVVAFGQGLKNNTRQVSKESRDMDTEKDRSLHGCQVRTPS